MSHVTFKLRLRNLIITQNNIAKKLLLINSIVTVFFINSSYRWPSYGSRAHVCFIILPGINLPLHVYKAFEMNFIESTVHRRVARREQTEFLEGKIL